ncbi:MAG: hypothetical protein ACJ72T_06930, partial [Nitrososphaeraceae archaeon]
LVFAGMFHIYRHGRTMAKAPSPPPRPAIPPTTAKPSPLPPKPAPVAPSTAERPLSPPPVQKTTGGQSLSQASQPRPESRGSSMNETKAKNIDNVSPTIKDAET